MQISHSLRAGLTMTLLGCIAALVIAWYPVQAASVTPQRSTDTPGCSATSGGSRSLGYTFGITIVPPSSGSFQFTPASNVALTGPIDSDESLRLNNVQDTSFDWESTLPLDAVIVQSAVGTHVYVYGGESQGDSGLVSMDSGSITQIEFCYDYELGFSASATGTFLIGEQWTLDRTVTPENVTGLIGETVSTRYTIVAERETIQYNYDVVGVVTIVNPSPYSVDLILNVQNKGELTTVTCTSGTTSANYVTVPGNTTANCTYNSDIFVERSVLGYWSLNPYVSPTGEGNAVIIPVLIDWSSSEGDAEASQVNDTLFGTLGTEEEPEGTFEFDTDVQCPTDPGVYVQGVYNAVQLSRSSAGSGDNEVSASNSVNITCYAPVVANRASATFNTRQSWEITRSADPEAQAAFAGETVNMLWITELAESTIEETPSIRGDVLITNSAPKEVTVSVAVTLDDETSVQVTDCQGAVRSGNSYTIPSLGQAFCQYIASPPTQDATLSRAVVTMGAYEFAADTGLEWRPGNELDGIRLEDNATRDQDNEIIFDDERWQVEGEYTCPTETRVYDDNGMYFADVETMSAIYDGSFELARDVATATVTCYLPTLSHTTTAGYEIQHEWAIEAEVAPTEHVAWAGESVETDWTVIITDTPIDIGTIVRGVIEIFNPHPINPLTVAVGAALDDRSRVTIECGNTLTIEAGQTGTCEFTARPETRDAKLSIASINFNRVNLYDEREFAWAEDAIQINQQVSIDDDNHQQGFPLSGVTGSNRWEYTTSYTCPLDPALYDEDGLLVYDQPNSAFLFTETDILGTANTHSSVICRAPIITTDASASYIDSWNWTMLISSSESAVSIAADTMQPISYLALLNVVPALLDVEVRGEITIENPHKEALPLTSIINEVARGQYARIQCDTLDLEPESSITCTYSASPTSVENGTTNVMITLPAGVMAVGAAYEFERLEERDRCVILTDSHFPDAPVARCADDDDLNYAYTLDFGAEGTEGVDLEVACGLSTHDSSILLQAMDSETEILSEIAIEINQECIVPEETPES